MDNKNLIIIVSLLMFIFLFVFIFFAIKRMIEENIMMKYIKNIINKTEESAYNRKLLNERQLEENGVIEKENILSKLDGIFEYCGLKKYISFINAEIFILINFIVSVSVFIIIFEITNIILYGFISFLLVWLLSITLVISMSAFNYKKTESNIILFMNLLENYSRTNSDIINILGQIYIYLNEPLRSITEKCYKQGMESGDVQQALEDFANAINHKKLKSIIRNIAVCSRFEANYEVVVEDSRSLLQEYLAGKNNRKAMYNSAKIEISIIIGFSFVMMFMLNNYMGIDVFKALTSSLIGNIISIYCIIVIAIAIIKIFFADFNKE